jgi:hypothetical protein
VERVANDIGELRLIKEQRGRYDANFDRRKLEDARLIEKLAEIESIVAAVARQRAAGGYTGLSAGDADCAGGATGRSRHRHARKLRSRRKHARQPSTPCQQKAGFDADRN